MDAKSKLKPCPFCGCGAETKICMDGILTYVQCTNCQARTKGYVKELYSKGDTIEQAEDAWNRRSNQ